MKAFARSAHLLVAMGLATAMATAALAQGSEAPGLDSPTVPDSVGGGSGQAAVATGTADPNSQWPCEQPMRPELSIGAMWSGPDPDRDQTDWRQLPAVAALVSEIAPRRTPQDEAVASIRRFAAGYQGDERTKVLTELFAGTFETLNAERNAIVRGIKRFYRRQDALAHRIEDGWKALGEIDPNATDPKLVEQRLGLQQQVDWDSRIFDDRQRLLHVVCDQPQVVVQRVFALSRAIQEQLPTP
jgi:hypothetical protein